SSRPARRRGGIRFGRRPRSLPRGRVGMKPLRVLVAGMVVADPNQGGATWAVLQYALGLQALGHTVELVDPVTSPSRDTERYRRSVVASFGLPVGLGHPQDSAYDVLLNLSGRLPVDRLPNQVPIRVYVDMDPAFTQLWHLDGVDVGLDGHTHF